jgi:hypothetical protein
MLDRVHQRDAVKGCTNLLAPFGISDAPGQEASARLPRARSSDLHLVALAESPAARSSPTASTASPWA